MKKSRILTASLASISLLTVSACVTDPNTGEKKVSRTVLGGAGGAIVGGLLGGVIGGKTGRIIGAVGGAAAGGYVGYRMDQQIKELKEQTAGSGVDVTEVDGGDAILVNLPDGVTFSTGSYTISPGFRDVLDRVAASLVQYPNSLVDVYGHTDTTGSMESNQRLSEQRAQAVANYLISRGVSSSRIRWMGFGETRLKIQTGDGVNEPLNRRVEIKIIPFDQQDVEAAQSTQGY
ncbi:OmpA family protein [Erythrobacter mangrovi]|uniref:17 kDa surface antigen n=1 Tax=Erythrobacter mangrovi TaxID=2739433 RepID=A0A7D4CCQ6_9SPHN|nr:OmpA family protein [Erythrobacter mangrovi]QKG70969.1 OmpA family protein [Erythrobacter mangrovi]